MRQPLSGAMGNRIGICTDKKEETAGLEMRYGTKEQKTFEWESTVFLCIAAGLLCMLLSLLQ